MVTYSDLVTLLLTFFVLLLSMASMDPVRFTQASSSLKHALGIPTEPTPVDYTMPITPSLPITKFTPLLQQNTKKVHEKIKNQIQALRINSDVETINTEQNTIILRLHDSILFAPNQTDITPKAYMILRQISDIVRPLPVLMRIEGHSDDISPGQTAISNWDLSIGRAVSVLRFFVQSDLLELDRMSAVGYGPDRPIAPNTTEENRAKNRRVDFVLRLKPPKTESKDSPAPL